VNLVSNISSLCDPDPPMSQTDRWMTCKTALCTIVHRAVKTLSATNYLRFAVSSTLYAKIFTMSAGGDFESSSCWSILYCVEYISPETKNPEFYHQSTRRQSCR